MTDGRNRPILSAVCHRLYRVIPHCQKTQKNKLKKCVLSRFLNNPGSVTARKSIGSEFYADGTTPWPWHWLASVHALGHTPTPFLSVDSQLVSPILCRSILLDYTFPVCPWPSWSLWKSRIVLLAVVCAGRPSVSDSWTNAGFFHWQCALLVLCCPNNMFNCPVTGCCHVRRQIVRWRAASCNIYVVQETHQEMR